MEARKFEAAAAAGLGDWERGTLFLAAVSGGADSTAMLAALTGYCRERDLILHCLHVEHGIRSLEESRGDAEAVKTLCVDLDIPCRIISLAPGKVAEAARKRGLGIEGAARFYRHRAWNREARRIGAARVLVAHTRDDLLETLLMGILRGSGPGGLAAMPREKGRILRPLLDLGRADILAYLEERSIPYRTDSTNRDLAFLRNRVRRKLIPCLDEFFPSWRKTLPALGETQGLIRDFLAKEAAEHIPWQQKNTGELETDRNNFITRHEILREEALFTGLDVLAGTDGKRLHRASFRFFTRGLVPVLDLGGLGIRDTGQTVQVFRKNRVWNWGFSLLIKEPGVYKLKGLTICVTAPPAYSNGRVEPGFLASLPLVLRRNYADDYIEQEKGKRRAVDVIKKGGTPDYTGIVSAEDSAGIAAFIGIGRKNCSILLLRQERETGVTKDGLFFFSIGGMDA